MKGVAESPRPTSHRLRRLIFALPDANRWATRVLHQAVVLNAFRHQCEGHSRSRNVTGMCDIRRFKSRGIRLLYSTRPISGSWCIATGESSAGYGSFRRYKHHKAPQRIEGPRIWYWSDALGSRQRRRPPMLDRPLSDDPKWRRFAVHWRNLSVLDMHSRCAIVA